MEIIEFLKLKWIEYDLAVNLLSSVAAVYTSIILSYFITLLKLRFILNDKPFYRVIVNKADSFLRYFPFILAGMLLVFIFPGSELVEFLFLVIYSTLFLVIKSSSPKNIKEEYILSAKSLGMPQYKIIPKILIKSIQPLIFKNIQKLHVHLWTLVIAIEIFKEGLGIGTVFVMTSDNSDLLSFSIIAAILVTIIFIGSACINYIHKKFYFWEL